MESIKVHDWEENPKQLERGHREDTSLPFPKIIDDFEK